MSDLRPYQAAALDAARASLRDVRGVLVVAPTGSGKGTMAARMLTTATERGRRALFVVHRQDLVRDIAERLRRNGVEHVGVAMGDETADDARALVTVGTVQTLCVREHAAVDLVILDEAHHATCVQHRAVVARHPNARIVGFTATPQRGDGTALGDVFERLIVVASVRALQSLGYLVPVSVVAPTQRQVNLADDPAAAYREFGGGRRAIFFARDRAHGRTIAESLLGANYIDALTEPDERRRVYNSPAPIVNVALATEGVDIPAVEVVVLARGVSHAGAYLQICGRALRPSPGKTSALIIDLCGAVHDHGLPDDDRTYSLAGKPIDLGEKVEAISQCAACGAVFRASEFINATCPGCGAVRPGRPDPRVVRARLEAVRADALAKLSSVDHVTFLRQQVEIAQVKGWKPGYALMQFERRWHRWPSKAERAAAGL